VTYFDIDPYENGESGEVGICFVGGEKGVYDLVLEDFEAKLAINYFDARAESAGVKVLD
jgi:hypothetical protein